MDIESNLDRPQLNKVVEIKNRPVILNSQPFQSFLQDNKDLVHIGLLPKSKAIVLYR